MCIIYLQNKTYLRNGEIAYQINCPELDEVHERWFHGEEDFECDQIDLDHEFCEHSRYNQWTPPYEMDDYCNDDKDDHIFNFMKSREFYTSLEKILEAI